MEAAWPSDQRIGLAVRRCRVRVPLWPLAGFVLGRPEFNSSATLVNSQLVASCQLGVLMYLINVLMYLNYLSCYCRVARQALPCYKAVARLGFKRRATAVPNSIHRL